ncbi:hypothetical protein PNEG_02215 [Pneumocystis murina B123]|uniref:RNA helicase n=1 Tax=Pneumocystis murina (strain B123) TaxID=1069680 RepID=M7NR86_PNEMU|nr:hypothetical protein PNEG_02215 [Pneumocystis murina B123]EMR09631.1 hypothetical protein PNEG_02215 [Pneumocystis murina B123]
MQNIIYIMMLLWKQKIKDIFFKVDSFKRRERCEKKAGKLDNFRHIFVLGFNCGIGINLNENMDSSLEKESNMSFMKNIDKTPPLPFIYPPPLPKENLGLPKESQISLREDEAKESFYKKMFSMKTQTLGMFEGLGKLHEFDDTANHNKNTLKDVCNDSISSELKRNEPLSIEELVKKEKELAAMNKPRFLTREQREEIALEKRRMEVKKKGQYIDKMNMNVSKNFFPKDGRNVFFGNNEMNGYTNGTKTILTGSKTMREEMTERQASGSSKLSLKKDDKKSELPIEEKEIEDIRKRYLGTTDNKKKRRKTTERKFVFDWDNTEDTSTDVNPIYSNRHSAQFLGRGRLGGFDDKNNKDYTNSYINVLSRSSNEEDRDRAKQLMELEYKKSSRISWDDMHWSEKPLELMKERDWRIFREDFSISSRGGSIPNPIRNWKESGLPKVILDMIKIVGYKEPSPIQRAAIPIGLQNRDIIGIAETGSGKTASFVLPMLVYISTLPPLNEYNKNDGPYAIILAPTRELAQQIETETKKFSLSMGFVCVSIVGGHKIEEQAFNLRDGVHIVIATPGRLLDCLERRVLVLSQCAYIVLDEADRMIDMGFEEAVNKLLDALPVRNQKPDTDDAENPVLMSKMIGGKERFRQTVMFSATMPPAVEKLAKKYLRRPAIVTIGNAGQAVDTVVQIVEMMNTEDKKRRRLEELLSSNDYSPPVIIFINQRRSCDALAKSLARIGWNAVTLHGGKSQEQRESALSQLRSGEADCLVATDLAGRGIDVADVSLVVNFNMAKNIEDYTHRIGRTGRAGKSGTAITFLTPEDTEIMYDLKQAISKSSISKVPDWLKMHEAAQRKPDKQPVKKPADELLFQIPHGRWY